eukprot:2832145-Rhodomonas_salina.5
MSPYLSVFDSVFCLCLSCCRCRCLSGSLVLWFSRSLSRRGARAIAVSLCNDRSVAQHHTAAVPRTVKA